jgi:hypothetical protein
MAHKKPKKPKKPKASASVHSWIKFDERMKHWHKKLNDIKHAHSKKASLIKKYAH